MGFGQHGNGPSDSMLSGEYLHHVPCSQCLERRERRLVLSELNALNLITKFICICQSFQQPVIGTRRTSQVRRDSIGANAKYHGNGGGDNGNGDRNCLGFEENELMNWRDELEPTCKLRTRGAEKSRYLLVNMELNKLPFSIHVFLCFRTL